MRRRILLCFLCFMLVFGVGSQCFAEDGNYEIKEAGMTLKVPEDFIVFERIVDEFDPNLELINSSKEKMEDMFNQGNIYLNGIMIPPNYELVVTLTEYAGSQDIFDFNYFTDKELDAMAKKLTEENVPRDTGITYTGYDIYKQNQAAFLVFDIIQENSSGQVYGKQYYTIINGQAINITLHGYNGEIPAGEASMLKGIVDSAYFKEVKVKPDSDNVEDLIKNVPVKAILIIGGIVIIVGITLIIVFLKRRHRYSGEEAYDEDDEEYEEDDDEYEENEFEEESNDNSLRF